MPALQIDRDYLYQTLINLVRINSINPSLVPGGAGEANIAAYVANALSQLGLSVDVHEAAPHRPNVVGTLRGQGGGKSLMLNAHMDTVGIENMPEPFVAEIIDGKLYGRGAYDMKGSLAAMLAAAKAVVDSGATLNGDLMLAGVADEEYASLGTLEVVKRYQPDAAIVTEPTEMQIALAHKGFIWYDVEVIGKAAHGSRPQLGIDANMKMGKYLHELEKLERELRGRLGHPLIGPPTLHASMIKGGTSMSVIADRCVLSIERRTLPGETEDQVTAELQALIDRVAEADRDFHATLRRDMLRDPFSVDEDAAIVRALDRAYAQTLKKQPDHAGVSFWTDAALHAAASTDTIVFGPHGEGAHAAEEWVDLQTVEDAALIYAQTALSYCR
ncbi:MAG: ArgE/DapE family deacylase [Chloroflexi bacterium]|nr:ArgE/DapE family deacylase [Chloroflexota bacterium]